MPIQIDNTVTTTITLAAPTSGSATLTFPAADGTSGQTLLTDGAGVLTWGALPTASTPGLTGTASTTGTNATVNIDALTIATTGSSTDQSIALVPKGTGSIVSFIPTSTTFGANNVSFQKQTTATSVSTGTGGSVTLGYDSNISSGQTLVTVGCTNVFTTNTNSGVSIAVGHPVLASTVNAQGNQSVQVLCKNLQNIRTGATAFMGVNMWVRRAYQHVLGGISADPQSTAGSSSTYYSLTHYTGTTAGSGAANAVFLYSDFNNSTANGNFDVPIRGNVFFWGWLTAGQTTGNAAYVWEIAGMATYNGTTLSFVGTPVVAGLGGDASLSTSVITLAISGNNITIKAQSALTGSTNFQFTCNEIFAGAY